MGLFVRYLDSFQSARGGWSARAKLVASATCLGARFEQPALNSHLRPDLNLTLVVLLSMTTSASPPLTPSATPEPKLQNAVEAPADLDSFSLSDGGSSHRNQSPAAAFEVPVLAPSSATSSAESAASGAFAPASATSGLTGRWEVEVEHADLDGDNVWRSLEQRWRGLPGGTQPATGTFSPSLHLLTHFAESRSLSPGFLFSRVVRLVRKRAPLPCGHPSRHCTPPTLPPLRCRLV